VRNKKLRTVLFGTAASLGAATLLPMQAVQAQTAADAILEEVVVTAQRREESLMDLPLSVVAITGEAMRAQGIYNTRQIGEFAANVHISESDRMGHSRIFIRGIGGGFPNPIQVFGSGMYIDNHYLPGSLATFMSTVDVERVEVLRGPQGTLFGKNVVGGAVNIVSTKPQPEFESDVTLRAGQYGQQDLIGMVNVPFSDQVYGRFSYASEQTDGAWYNRHRDTDRQSYRDTQSFRGALRYMPTDNWTIDFTGTMSAGEGGQPGAQCKVHPSQAVYDKQKALGFNVDTYTPHANGVGQWGGGDGHPERLFAGATQKMWQACSADVGMGDFVTSGQTVDYNEEETNAAFLSAVWNSNGAVGAFENVVTTINASWRDTKFRWAVDRDKTPVNIDTLGHTNTGDWGSFITTRNAEILFDLTISDRASLILGANVFEETSKTGDGDCWHRWVNEYLPAQAAGGNPDIACGPAAGPGHGGLIFEFLPDRATPGGPGNAFQQVNVYTDSTAAFGHYTFNINDTWDFALGARWTEDYRDFNILEFEAGGGALLGGQLQHYVTDAGVKKTTTSNGKKNDTCNIQSDGTICQVKPYLNDNNVLREGFINWKDATFSAVTPTMSFTRNLAPNDTLDSGMIYFLISEGYLTGSFNDEMNLFLTPELAPLVSYDPEHVVNYEVGFKGTMGGGRLVLNGDIFLMDYTDKHEPVVLNNDDGRYGPDPNLELTQNAGEVEIYGVEVELRASPWDGGFLTFDGGYLFSDYNEFIIDDPDNIGSTLDLSDRKIADRTPDWTMNASIGHTFILGSGAQLTPVVGVYGQGEYEWLSPSLVNDPDSFCHQEAYAKFRARVTYLPPSSNWEASLYGSNITDHRYFEECGNSRSGIFDYRWGNPATWGVEFVARFGNN